MSEHEKIIKGLECCHQINQTECFKCPYARGNGCTHALMGDVLALLKAQEPRVLTLEELKSLERDTVVWYEHNGVNKPRPRIVDQVYDSGIIFTDGGHWHFTADAYGKKFRLWTACPTDGQRKAVKWDK